MADYEAIKNRLNLMKQAILLETSGASNYKKIIKDALKILYPNIPEKACDKLASNLFHLDNDEILQMGKDQITVNDLLFVLAQIIEMSPSGDQTDLSEDNA